MRLESVRSLKQEILAETLTRHVVTIRALPKAAAVAVSALPEKPTPPQIALGIERKGGEYRLAIRIRAITPGLQRNLDQIFRRARGEASVKVVGQLVKQQIWPMSRSRPLFMGCSTGHINIAAGTIGCFVTSDGSDRLLLSNNHVLADENRASLGDEILQPAPADFGLSPQDRVATLARFVPLQSLGKNLVDAAVATLDDTTMEERFLLTGLGALNGLRTTPLQGEETVFKIGRTTGLTRGRISAFDIDDVWVRYDMGLIGFDGQLEIEPLDGKPFSLGGDSGALIVDEDLHAVGLLFAGNDVDTSYANPIQEVLLALRIRLF
ncbi:MAG TPA: hypothetical protein VLQ45_26165 [Thermoanaerobaculia bacterium]|nr:hypothetical protein [Thermoanaerobaculia bacterium]